MKLQDLVDHALDNAKENGYPANENNAKEARDLRYFDADIGSYCLRNSVEDDELIACIQNWKRRHMN